MADLELNTLDFDNLSELSRDVTAQDLRRLAMHCLLSTNQDQRRRRINSGKSIAWVSDKPDFEHYERASFSISRNGDLPDDAPQGANVWSFKARYLSQKYPAPEPIAESDELIEFEKDFAGSTDCMSDWGKGELTTLTAYWSDKGYQRHQRSTYELPSLDKIENDKLDVMLLTNQIDSDVVGDAVYEQLRQDRELPVSERMDGDILMFADLMLIKSAISRLAKTKPSHQR